MLPIHNTYDWLPGYNSIKYTMNIKEKILNLPGYCIFTQNEAGRCENRDIGKAKS